MNWLVKEEPTHYEFDALVNPSRPRTSTLEDRAHLGNDREAAPSRDRRARVPGLLLSRGGSRRGVEVPSSRKPRGA